MSDDHRHLAKIRLLMVGLLICVNLSWVLAIHAEEADSRTVIDLFWEEVNDHISSGQSARAIMMLNSILEEYAASEEILRTAYNYIVFAYQAEQDEVGALAAACQALQRFPDASADILKFPPSVGATYDHLRTEMFGSLKILSPAGCQIYLNDGLAGETPLYLEYVLIGEYELRASQQGHKDHVSHLEINPSETLAHELTMERSRGFLWWATRVGVVAGGALIAATSGGSDSPAEPGALPRPPAPPE